MKHYVHFQLSDIKLSPEFMNLNLYVISYIDISICLMDWPSAQVVSPETLG